MDKTLKKRRSPVSEKRTLRPCSRKVNDPSETRVYLKILGDRKGRKCIETCRWRDENKFLPSLQNVNTKLERLGHLQ